MKVVASALHILLLLLVLVLVFALVFLLFLFVYLSLVTCKVHGKVMTICNAECSAFRPSYLRCREHGGREA